jgi:hypothetical protein
MGGGACFAQSLAELDSQRQAKNITRISALDQLEGAGHTLVPILTGKNKSLARNHNECGNSRLYIKPRRRLYRV